MKCQSLFSGKKRKEKYLKLSAALVYQACLVLALLFMAFYVCSLCSSTSMCHITITSATDK